MSTSNFKTACEEYRYLRERDYPEKAALKIVADKHRLGRVERNCLFRGIVAPLKAEARKKRIVAVELAVNALAGEALGIDWYNVLITVESYLRGHAVFICEDGVVRDSSATHGSYRVTPLTSRAMAAIVAAVRECRPRRIDAYLDSPIAFSALMAEELRGALAEAGAHSDVVLVHSADYPLKTYPGIVASSDSTILDAAERSIDLARLVLARSFEFTPPLVAELFP